MIVLKCYNCSNVYNILYFLATYFEIMANSNFRHLEQQAVDIRHAVVSLNIFWIDFHRLAGLQKRVLEISHWLEKTGLTKKKRLIISLLQ